MAIKTDAMIAHNRADGYTIHINYDPDTDDFDLKALFNDGTVKDLQGSITDGSILKTILEGTVTEIEDSTIIKLRSTALGYCSSLRKVVFDNVMVVSSSAFLACSGLKIAILPAVTTIANLAFNGNSSLEYVYIGDGATSINNDSFNNTKSGIVIDCGFSADSPVAANAPWGATNATINYDVPVPNPPAGLSLVPNPGLIQNIDLEPIEDIQPVVEVKKTKRSSK